MTITANGVRTPVADKYRAHVLTGLDQLQADVTSAGGIESYMLSHMSPGVKVMDILWDGESLSIHQTGAVDPETGAILIQESETEPTTDVGTIRLASWWRSMPWELSLISFELSDDAGSVEGVRTTWLSYLYPSGYDQEMEQFVVSMLTLGQMPLNIELEAVGVTLEAMTRLQHDDYLDFFLGDSQYARDIARVILDYYLIQKKAPSPALNLGQVEVIWDWVLKDDTKLQAAYLAAKEVTA